jgi:two-component system NtrC family sensor kinase
MVRPRILYVDDDPENLLVLRMAFRKEYDIKTCTSGAEGLLALQEETFPVVLADQRMPEMTGVEFLQHVREQWPDTRRIVITAYTDVNAVIDAINLGHIYHFLRKPWERAEVEVVLRNAVQSYEMELKNRSLTDELLRKEKLATLGQFVSGLAHEIRNQLNVRGFTDAILARYPEDDYLRERVEMIQGALTVIHDMVEEIRDFTRGISGPGELRTNDLARIVTDSLALLRYDPDLSGVQLDTEARGPALVHCHAGKIKQVLINLVKNAAHAVRGRSGGHVRVDVGASPAEGQVRLVVSDNGCGIAPENLSRLFEPFFTTKGDKGTGLGLMICKRIVQSHGGTIGCRSAPGEGTTFEIDLPGASLPAVA